MQTLLFSATMPSALHEFAKAGLKDPEMVRLDTDTKISQELSTAFFTVRLVSSHATSYSTSQATCHVVAKVTVTGLTPKSS